MRPYLRGACLGAAGIMTYWANWFFVDDFVSRSEPSEKYDEEHYINGIPLTEDMTYTFEATTAVTTGDNLNWFTYAEVFKKVQFVNGQLVVN